jgi:hypothetical protein
LERNNTVWNVESHVISSVSWKDILLVVPVNVGLLGSGELRRKTLISTIKL